MYVYVYEKQVCKCARFPTVYRRHLSVDMDNIR